MLGIAWQQVLTRPARYAGSFVALALGVALVAATGLAMSARPGQPPQSRFAAGTVVVTADPRLPPARGGALLGAPPGLPAPELERLATIPGVRGVLADRSFDAYPLGPGGPVTVPGTLPRGHGWSSAGFGPYPLAAGRAPATEDEVAVDGRLAAAAGWVVGTPIEVLTEAGAERYVVAGVTAPAGTAEAPVFFTDTRAAALSDRVTAAVLLPGPGTAPADLAAAVRASDPGLRALSGVDRRALEPDPVAAAYAESATLLGLMAGIGGFVSIFVVAGTFALAVAQRRRELALLRVVGATPRQLRRLVRYEAVTVALASGAVGGVLTAPVGYALVWLLRRLDVGPPDLALRPHPAPLLVAAGVGLVVALLGVSVAARRTRRIRPVEALREAAVERRAMTVPRWLIGVVGLAGGTAMLAAMPSSGGDDRTSLALLVGEVLVVGAAALAPALARLVVRLTAPPLRLTGPAAEVAAANLRAQARRTASVAAPVLVLVGVTGSFLVATGSLVRSAANEQRAQAATELVVVPVLGPGLSTAALAEASTVEGVAAVEPVGATHVFYRGDAYSTNVVPPSAVHSGALRLPVRTGSLDGLAGDTFAAGAAFAADRGWHVGDVVPVLLDDGSPADLRLVATVDGGLFGGNVYLPADRAAGHLAPWSVSHALVRLRPGADPAAVRDALSMRLTRYGAAGLDRAAWLDRSVREQQEGLRIGVIAILGLAACYAAIAIVNTLTMAVRERRRDIAQLRLAGATPGQALGMLLWEGGLVATVGIALGGVVTAVTAVAMPVALATFSNTARAAVPWPVLLGVAGGCAALVLATSAATGAAALRHRPLDALAVPQ